MPEQFQEGAYVKNCQGEIHNIGKIYKPTPSRSKLPVVKKPPPLEVRHHGDQNDLGIDPDYSMNVDFTLPTEEEVRGSYGNVFILH